MAAELHKAAVFEDIIYYQNSVRANSGETRNIALISPVTVFLQTASFNGTINIIGKTDIPQLLIYKQTVNNPVLKLNSQIISIITDTIYHFA